MGLRQQLIMMKVIYGGVLMTILFRGSYKPGCDRAPVGGARLNPYKFATHMRSRRHIVIQSEAEQING